MTTKKSIPQKFSGRIDWISDSDAELGIPVKRAILESHDSINLEFESDGTVYGVSLKKTRESLFRGTFETRHGGEGTASCELYANENGYFLFGQWVEDDYESTWWAQLRRVKRFSDESKD